MYRMNNEWTDGCAHRQAINIMPLPYYVGWRHNNYYYPVPDTSGDGVLFSIDFFVSFFVSKIMKKQLDRFAWNFQGRCGVTMGWRDSIFGQFGETARCCDANFFCQQHHEQTAEPICMKFSGNVWSDHGMTWLHFWSIPRNRTMPRSATRGTGFVVLPHRSLFVFGTHYMIYVMCN